MKPERVEDTLTVSINLLEGSLEHVSVGNFRAAMSTTTEVGAKVAKLKGPKQRGAFDLVTEIAEFLNAGRGASAAAKIRSLIKVFRDWQA